MKVLRPASVFNYNESAGNADKEVRDAHFFFSCNRFVALPESRISMSPLTENTRYSSVPTKPCRQGTSAVTV